MTLNCLSNQSKENLEKEIERAELYAKFNMLDARLSMENLDMLIEGDALNQKDVKNAEVLKEIAKEQETWNYDFLTKNLEAPAVERMEKFSRNSMFALASKGVSRWYGVPLAEKYGVRRGYRPHPNCFIGHICEHIGTLVTKLKTKIYGMDAIHPVPVEKLSPRHVEILQKLVPDGDKKSAIVLNSLLHEPTELNISPKLQEEYATGRELQMFAILSEVAERNFNDYSRKINRKKTQKLDLAKERELER